MDLFRRRIVLQDAHKALRVGLSLVLAVTGLSGQEAPRGLDQEHALVISAGDALCSLDYVADFSGKLYLWAESEELDPVLRVLDEEGWLVAEDERSGGPGTPFVVLDVEPGQVRAVLLAASVPDELGAVTLHVISAPESEATRAAARRAWEAFGQVERTRGEGESEAARALAREIARELSSIEGSDQSAGLARVRWELGFVAWDLGDLQTANEAWSKTRDHRERTLPECHRDLLSARTNLALVMKELHDPAGSRAIQETVLAVLERILPADDPELLLARLNLCNATREMGDLVSARKLAESLVASYERTVQEDDLGLLRARLSLAAVMDDSADFPGARAIFEDVLESFERILPADHIQLLAARQNLANTMMQMGDFVGARVLAEGVLDSFERSLPEDHPTVLSARHNLAAIMEMMGDHADALVLHEAVLAVRERSLSAEHPQLLTTRVGLASILRAGGDLASARALEEEVLEVRERTLSKDHPSTVAVRGNLGSTLGLMGEFDAARALAESVLEARERDLPRDHIDILRARGNLASALVGLGDVSAARATIEELLRGMLRRIESLAVLSPREVRAAASGESHRLSVLLSYGDAADSELIRELVFALIETLRHVSQSSLAAASGADSALHARRAEIATVRARMNDLVAGGAAAEREQLDLTGEMARLSRERDRLERELRVELGERAGSLDAVRVQDVARALADDAAAVGFRRLEGWRTLEETDRLLPSDDRLFAHVVRPDGSFERLDLGVATELEALASDWRAAIGSPIQSRGVPAKREHPASATMARRTGAELRARVLDPITAAAGGARTLHLCLDDMLHLVPLDALPLGDGVVGDQLQLRTESSFARLIAPGIRERSGPGFLALGAVDHAAAPTDPVSSSRSAASPPVEAGSQGGSAALEFAALPETSVEIESLARLFEESFEVEPLLMTGARATKYALHTHAPGRRFLHLATHGWFAPESVPSVLDDRERDGSWAPTGMREAVTGLAPMTLCGLALAGANRGRDSLGRVPGIMTAEELAGIDLSACELAVLSACETNVGVRRAGQGIQSLQAALLAAGVRTAVTSLWKVDDRATRELMELFYAKLWVEELPKAEALWQAKAALRARGAPLRDWAGWVLSGDPE